jgi:predicted ATPase/transcriptional regulator with XRE-family HTH domain
VAAPVPSPSASLAEVLRDLREAAGLTQEEVARRAGLTAHAVSALERGARTRPYPHTVRSLADALRLEADARSTLFAAVPRRGGSPVVAPAGPAAAPVRPAVGPPVPPTPLLGRQRELEVVADLLQRPGVRLVTLTGLGGVGKTRLALALAEQLLPTCDEVVWVPLAALTDPALVLTSVGRAVGVPGAEGLDPREAVAERLRGRRVLLVVDNVEHVLDAAADLGDLLERCPDLVVLATSRAALRLRAEREVPVPPLGLPGGGERVADSAAVALFVERAAAVSPGFALTAENASDVAEVCRRLAGIPLALELAAAKVRLLEPGALLDRLDAAMRTGGARDLPARQRTMQATLDWSHDLLGPAEQGLLRRLSVSRGGVDLELAEALGGPGSDVVAGLERLVEHSLLHVRTGPTGALRYEMLEPVLQYARARLTDPQESREVRLAHVHHMLSRAEAAVPDYRRATAVDALRRTDADEDNHTAAIEYALELGEPDLAGRHGWALWLYWWLRGRLRLGRRLMEEVLARDPSPRVGLYVGLCVAALGFAQGDVAGTGGLWTQSFRTARELGDLQGMAHGLAGTGLVGLATGDLELAERGFREAVPLAEQADEDEQWLWTLSHVWLGTVALLRGQPQAALALVETGLVPARRRGDRLVVSIGLFTASQAEIALGDHEGARRRLEEGVVLSHETRDLANLAYFLDALAVVEAVAGRAGHEGRIATLLGAAQGLREAAGPTVYGFYRPDDALLASAAARARRALGDDAWDDAVDRGRALEVDDVVPYVLSIGATPRPAPSPAR